MKQLIIENGGMPFTGDDLVYLQGGLLEGLQAAITPFLRDNKAILSGVEYDGVNLSAGWVVIDNEILFYEGEAISDISNYELSITELYDPAGTDVFADGVSRDTYQLRKAILTISGVASGTIISSNDFDKYRITGVNDEQIVILNDPAYIAKFVQVGNVVHYGIQVTTKIAGSSLAFAVSDIDPPALQTKMDIYYSVDGDAGDCLLFGDANNNLAVIINGDSVDSGSFALVSGSYVI